MKFVYFKDITFPRVNSTHSVALCFSAFIANFGNYLYRIKTLENFNIFEENALFYYTPKLVC